MKSLFLLITVIFFSYTKAAFPGSDNLRKVYYIIGTVTLTNGNHFELSDGSVWYAENPAHIGSSFRIVIILNSLLRKGSAFVHGKEINVEHVSGNFTYYNGYYSKVVGMEDKGAVLLTEDGSGWSVPDYQRTDTSKWKVPYNVLISSDGLFMTNLNNDERIIVSRRNR